MALGKQPSWTSSDENPAAKVGRVPTDCTLHEAELRDPAAERENRLWLRTCRKDWKDSLERKGTRKKSSQSSQYQ